MKSIKADVVIIGSGIAGLYAAKRLAKKMSVVLITKGKMINSNSILAQGGIAAAIDKDDNWQEHLMDTLEAGVNHNNEAATRHLVKSAPKAIERLLQLGVPFDRDTKDELELGQEGGHHKRRIIHAGGDSTGREIIHKLIEAVKENVTIYENETAIDLVVDNNKCVGVLTKDQHGNIKVYSTDHTILATGGIGNLYQVTSNDITISGDGLAMAYRAGAELIDMEFIQFHPTMLSQNGIAYGLVSEAVRGEGAKLIDQFGTHIMKGIHPLKDLAPRDIVARRIYEVTQAGNKVYLDISSIKNFRKRFPTITSMCVENGIEIDTGRLPVSPGAHFIMGGIKTDLKGRTSIPGLYAVGEVSYTGVHGANRLASNSLLEGLVFAEELSDYIQKLNQRDHRTTHYFPKLVQKNISLPEISEIQQVMTENVGIIRKKERLEFARDWFAHQLIDYVPGEILDLSPDGVTKLNMLMVGWLITTSALIRTESRGGHFREDYPNLNNDRWLKRYIARRREENESYQVKDTFTAAIY